jgi:hypothetical protein
MTDIVKQLRAMSYGAGDIPERAADEIERLDAVLKLGHDMRQKQAVYFKDRSKDNLIASKVAEAAFDKACKAMGGGNDH